MKDKWKINNKIYFHSYMSNIIKPKLLLCEIYIDYSCFSCSVKNNQKISIMQQLESLSLEPYIESLDLALHHATALLLTVLEPLNVINYCRGSWKATLGKGSAC